MPGTSPKAHLTVLQEEEGDPIVINKMKRDLRSLAMDIWGYQNGMRPDGIRADKFQTAWWWNEVDEDQWRRGERFDFWWDLLEPEVFEPYFVFSTTDVAPGLNTSENTMKSFVLEMNRKNWEAAGGMIKDGGSLNRAVNGGIRFTSIDGGQQFLGQFEKFEVFSKSAFQLDGVDYVWWLLQARTKYQPEVYGRLLDFEELGCPIQVITRKDGNESWSVSTEFLDSRVMDCVSEINGMPRRWVLQPKENNSYWVNLGDGSWGIDSETFKSKMEPFLNPSKR